MLRSRSRSSYRHARLPLQLHVIVVDKFAKLDPTPAGRQAASGVMQG